MKESDFTKKIKKKQKHLIWSYYEGEIVVRNFHCKLKREI
jgi:hypothetical protein